MLPAINSFVVQPKKPLFAVCATFLLIVSPSVLESPQIHLSVVLLATLSATFRNIHSLGIILIGVPGLLALLFADGNQKSWLALLAIARGHKTRAVAKYNPSHATRRSFVGRQRVVYAINWCQ